MEMKRRVLLNGLVMLLFLAAGSTCVYSQDFPAKPVPPRLVNDFAGFLNQSEMNSLENKLVAFNDSTSTQISIVIVKDLNGYDKADYAQRLAEKWGIGQKGLNNGVLILVKPKTADSRGEVQVTTGYGLGGATPDLLCGEIVDREILPSFRNGNYYEGLDKATSTLMSLARKEFSASDYQNKSKKSSGKDIPFGLVIFIVVIIIAMVSKGSGGSNNRHISTGGLPFWMLMGMMNSGRGSGGSWGGFSGGSSSGGGFGGFGGGSFGGGGAGGSW
jgi:uncharacterized protein